MKKYTLHILLIILCFNLKAQFHSHYRQVELKKTIDKCNIAIVYTYKFSLDTIKRTPKYDKQILEIGKTYAKYSSI
ncbi:MAG: hypothetical protein LBS69_02955, partial [Prevotellaceae bacterium]|nr:hypothetical protein [Prevotellaceae bacterium]